MIIYYVNFIVFQCTNFSKRSTRGQNCHRRVSWRRRAPRGAGRPAWRVGRRWETRRRSRSTAWWGPASKSKNPPECQRVCKSAKVELFSLETCSKSRKHAIVNGLYALHLGSLKLGDSSAIVSCYFFWQDDEVVYLDIFDKTLVALVRLEALEHPVSLVDAADTQRHLHYGRWKN